MNEQNGKQEVAEYCGAGCDCGSKKGLSKGARWAICGVVALAAVATATVHASRVHAAESQNANKAGDYASLIPAITATNAAKPVVELAGWGAPLKGLAELNTVATNTEAVFVVVPSGDGDRTAAIQKEVGGVVATLTAKGTKVGMFLLSRDAQEYAAVVQQVGAPTVLAMVKGRGMAAVNDKDVTQAALLKAYVGASRPSGCGPSGCGPGASSGCGPSVPACK